MSTYLYIFGLVCLAACVSAQGYGRCCACSQCYQQPSYSNWNNFGGFSSSQTYSKSESWSSSQSSNYGSSGSRYGGCGYCSFNDVPKDAKIDDAKTACLLFIQQFNEEPLATDKINEFVNTKFSGKIDQVQKSGVIEGGSKEFAPFIFQCCHVKFGKALLGADAGPGDYQLPTLPKGATCDSVTDGMFKALKESQKKKQ